MLTDWLAWLDETQHWVETIAVAEVPSARSESTEVDDESVSDTSSASASETDGASGAALPRSDLYTLLAAMTALRQEVNLQTRSARRDREQAVETLETLSSAVDQLSREREEKDTSTEVDVVHVDVLLELHDALSRAERQASQVIASTVETLRDWCSRNEIESETDGASMEIASEAAPGSASIPTAMARTRTFGRLRGWLGGRESSVAAAPTVEHEPPGDAAAADDRVTWGDIGAESGRMADRLEGLVTGYQLSLQRLERVLATCGIEPIACLGQSIDPEVMEVVQVVSDATQPPGMVADEVRCGYRRYGQVYRFAQVVATRSDAASSHTPMEHTPDI